ncbi:cyclic GMP-AMP synthase-like [Pristis pectinata]|uniref:cyclic GMP-AMP synthase-like n=1 Tax=Pristis pectinata TaxID=685728 RepID=UPI00223D7EA7|nr:cyclic GMP-AMP synthase-like [Pristis pectinata]
MSQKAVPRRSGDSAAAKPTGSGAKPKGRRGEGRDPERRPRHSGGAGVEDDSSHGGPADTGGKNRGRGERNASSRRSAGDKENIPGRAARVKDTIPGRAAGDKGIIPGRAAGDKGIIPGRAAGDKGIIPGRAAGDKDTIPGRAAGDEGKNASSDVGSGTSRAAGASRDAEDGTDIRAPRTGGSEGAGDLDKLLRTVLGNLRIRSDERSKAARLVNQVVDHLLRYISKDPNFASIKKLPSGSYYEKVKISEPNEFDIMITVPVGRIKYTEADFEGAFYQVEFKRCTGANPLVQFVSNGKLSAEKMLCHLRNLIKVAARSLPDFNIKVERKKSGSPAVTLEIEGECVPISLDIVLALEVKTQSWPPSTTEGLKIEKWLGNKVRSEFRREPFYLVPKQQPLENVQGAKTESQEEMWRISFSHIEKKIIMNHGSSKTCCESNSPKCCRKSCLKLLKNLIQKLKEKHCRILACVCSYHAKTTLLHACVKWPKDDMWQLEDLADCFLRLLANFIEHLKSENLPHFFIPSYNLFDPRIFDPKSRIRLLDFVKKERSKNFPIFGVNLSSQ